VISLERLRFGREYQAIMQNLPNLPLVHFDIAEVATAPKDEAGLWRKPKVHSISHAPPIDARPLVVAQHRQFLADALLMVIERVAAKSRLDDSVWEAGTRHKRSGETRPNNRRVRARRAQGKRLDDDLAHDSR
jgi:hypothetical protein